MSGREMRIQLNPDIAVKAGAYDIEINVQNPAKLPHENIWRLEIRRPVNDIRFEQHIPGYDFGRASPEILAPPANLDGGSVRSAISTWCVVLVLILSVFLF